MHLKFNKRVGRTIETGRITVPKKFDSDLDKRKYCPLGISVDVTYILPNGFKIPGRLYQSENNSTTYYQFYIIESNDKIKFKNQLINHSTIQLDFVLEDSCLAIIPM